METSEQPTSETSRAFEELIRLVENNEIRKDEGRGEPYGDEKRAEFSNTIRCIYKLLQEPDALPARHHVFELLTSNLPRHLEIRGNAKEILEELLEGDEEDQEIKAEQIH